MATETAPLAKTVPPLAKEAARKRHLAKRHAAERRFRVYGIISVLIGLGFLVTLFANLATRGASAFMQSSFTLEIPLDKSVLAPTGEVTEKDLRMADYGRLAKTALMKALGVNPASKPDARAAQALLSANADTQVRDAVLANPALIGSTITLRLLADSNVDAVLKGQIDRGMPEERRKISNKQLSWIDKAVETGFLAKHFNWGLFTYGASSKPESAGIGVALVGSITMMIVVLLLAVPLGVAAAVYLEEFAPKNMLTDAIEVNINNLAAVPSIVFGLLGLAIFINFAGLPRSASLVGGLVLALMTLPTIIIATRAALAAVPPSIRDAALGIGASKMQAVMHHVLPLAVPGILTGTIIGLAKALGETAPLLMIGMVAFVVEYPRSPLDSATALPVQIYMWATAAEHGFIERTAGATLVLLAFLVIMNIAAVFVRRRYERRW